MTFREIKIDNELKVNVNVKLMYPLLGLLQELFDTNLQLFSSYNSK